MLIDLMFVPRSQRSALPVVADGMFPLAPKKRRTSRPTLDARRLPCSACPDLLQRRQRLPLMSLRYLYEGGAPWRIMATRSIPREEGILLVSAPSRRTR